MYFEICLTVEVENSQSSSSRTVIASKQPVERPGRKPGFDYNRLGGKKPFDPTNTTLELRKIPREQNTITKLNEHFSKFGTIVNLQVSLFFTMSAKRI